MAEAPVPQPVLAGLTSAAVFLTADINPGGEDAVRDALADFSGLTRAVGFRRPGDRLAPVIGIGSDAYDRLFAGPRPAELHPFAAIEGDRHRAPATGGDLLMHVRAASMDLCFEFAAQFTGALGSAITITDEVHGFRYFEQRDLLGFVDGTENPDGTDAETATLITDQDSDFAGGSFVIVQKYLHDLAAWDAISVEEQERVIGRSKLSDIEMADDVKPPTSHVALTSITDEDGNDLDIVRDNMPFGSIAEGEFGTYFIGYSASPAVIERMLINMFIGDPPGTTDRILDFSTAFTGALFFVPSRDFLDDLPDPPAVINSREREEAQAGLDSAEKILVGEPGPAPLDDDDTSLRIGSLKGV
ncbi:Dyp-type peroxidase [Microlunatus elymi]|uniref:Dyp-type peroxidase n=1 Tax=Microlunatus elymi TaxID=2596828 RepID=UPI001D18420A|nr:Dyp-type peroxidase [Microlunatus elymi]